MDNLPTALVPTQTAKPVSPTKLFTWIFLILFLIAAGLAGWFYYQNRQLKQKPIPLPSPSLAASPQPSFASSPSAGEEISWKTTKHFGASFDYPEGWHVAELWQDNYSQNGIMIAIDPNPISTAPRGGPLATFEITFLNGNPNPDEILQQRMTSFNNENYYDITKETIDANIGKVYYYKGKVAGEMMRGAAMESYFFTFNRYPNDPLNQQVVIANLTFKDDPQLSEMLRHIVLSFKEL